MWLPLSPEIVRVLRSETTVRIATLFLVWLNLAILVAWICQFGNPQNNIFIVLVLVLGWVGSLYKPLKIMQMAELGKKYAALDEANVVATVELFVSNVGLVRDLAYMSFLGDIIRVRGLRLRFDFSRAELERPELWDSTSKFYFRDGFALRITEPTPKEEFEKQLSYFLEGSSTSPEFRQMSLGAYIDEPYHRTNVMALVAFLIATTLLLVIVCAHFLTDGTTSAAGKAYLLIPGALGVSFVALTVWTLRAEMQRNQAIKSLQPARNQ